MSTPIEARVAFFAHKRATGRNMPVCEILEGIKSGQWAVEVAKLRTHGRDAHGYEKRKARLPSFTMSAATNGGRKAADVIRHSGLIQVDVDQVGKAAAPDLRDRLGEDRHILAAWISPSGDGVKAALCVPAEMACHEAAFQAAMEYLREKHGVTIDPACSDVSRQCFVSHDPGLLLNETCQPMVVASARSGLGRAARGGSSSLLLHPPSSILYNKCDLFTKWPRLALLFKRHVLDIFPDPQPGHRNQILTDMVPRLIAVVKEDFVMAFALEYYDQHVSIFLDYPRAKYEAEASSLIAGCLESYLHRLGPESKAAYLRLNNALAWCRHQIAA